jgi:hypothetical protein
MRRPNAVRARRLAAIGDDEVEIANIYPRYEPESRPARAKEHRLEEETSEQKSRHAWPRAWKWLGPEFTDRDPRTIQPEHFFKINQATGEVHGLLARIERETSNGTPS